MKCPACENACVEPAAEVLAGIEQRYMACSDCAPEPNLDKALKLESLPGKIERCQVMRQSNAGCGNAGCFESLAEVRPARRYGHSAKRRHAAYRCGLSSGLFAPPWPEEPDNSGGTIYERGGRGHAGANSGDKRGNSLQRRSRACTDRGQNPWRMFFWPAATCGPTSVRASLGSWSSTRASQKYISSFPGRALPR